MGCTLIHLKSLEKMASLENIEILRLRINIFATKNRRSNLPTTILSRRSEECNATLDM